VSPHIIGNKQVRLLSKPWQICAPCLSLPALSLELLEIRVIIQKDGDPTSSFLLSGSILVPPLGVWEARLELLSYLTWSRGLSYDLLEVS